VTGREQPKDALGGPAGLAAWESAEMRHSNAASMLQCLSASMCAAIAGIEPRWSIILLFVIVWIP